MSYYYPPVNFWSVWFSEIVLKNLKANNVKISATDSILDIGCGLGNHCFSLLEFSPREIHGFDISFEIIELLQTFSNEIHFKNVDICKDDISNYRNKFDIIFSCDVYEHVEDPQVMLNNIYTILKDGGSVSITFPNFDHHGHNQLYNLDDLSAKIHNAGFRKHKIEIIDDRSLIYKLFTRFYVLLQDISDKIYGIKRNNNRMPDSDEFHEMYAYTKINKIKDKRLLVKSINFLYAIMKKIGRLSSVYLTTDNKSVLRDKRIVFWAQK